MEKLIMERKKIISILKVTNIFFVWNMMQQNRYKPKREPTSELVLYFLFLPIILLLLFGGGWGIRQTVGLLTLFNFFVVFLRKKKYKLCTFETGWGVCGKLDIQFTFKTYIFFWRYSHLQ